MQGGRQLNWFVSFLFTFFLMSGNQGIRYCPLPQSLIARLHEGMMPSDKNREACSNTQLEITRLAHYVYYLRAM